MGELAEAVQEASGELVELAQYVEQGYDGERAAKEAEAHGIGLEVVKKHPAEAKRGFVLSCRAAGLWNAISRGHRESGAWSRTTRGYPPL